VANGACEHWLSGRDCSDLGQLVQRCSSPPNTIRGIIGIGGQADLCFTRVRVRQTRRDGVGRTYMVCLGATGDSSDLDLAPCSFFRCYLILSRQFRVGCASIPHSVNGWMDAALTCVREGRDATCTTVHTDANHPLTLPILSLFLSHFLSFLRYTRAGSLLPP